MNNIKRETVEEFIARGGKVRQVDFQDAHAKSADPCRNFRDYKSKPSNNQIHKKHMENVIKTRKAFANATR